MSMGQIWGYRKWILGALVLVLLLVGISRLEFRFRDDLASASAVGSVGGNGPGDAAPPDAAKFEEIAQSATLSLKIDRTSGHFMVEDLRNGQIWHSYPHPDDWDNEEIGGAWRNHLLSPLMFQYMDFSTHNAPARESSFTQLNGTIEDVLEIDGGVQWTYVMPEMAMSLVVQIRVQDDYVETRIVDSTIEEGSYSLLWLRLFPFFGATHAKEEEGYLFIPDGSGALIAYDADRPENGRGYQESVYGRDPSFQSMSRFSTRLPVNMPVFGMKNGDSAMLAVVEQGAAYSDIYAAPAGLISRYNWITAQMIYRLPYEQITNRNKGTGFTTYNKEQRFGEDRVIRYYLLADEEANYVGMAQRYRRYLQEERGMTRMKSASATVPMQVMLLGADTMDGMVGERYLPLTTTDEASEIVQALRAQGVEQLSVTYLGWQEDGVSAYGGYAGTDQRLGGDAGMKRFIALMQEWDIPVTLGVQYEMNNTGRGGFKPQYAAVRDLAGTIQEVRVRRARIPVVSADFQLKQMQRDLARYKELGGAGLYLMGSGSYLYSDYNTRTGGTRSENAHKQREMALAVRQALGQVNLAAPHMYMIDAVDHIYRMPADYSYDLFADKAVPFLQIALHGLVSYTSGEANERERWTYDFLKDIELGAQPAFIFTAAQTEKLTQAHGMQLMSSHYKDWLEAAADQYQRYNEALTGLQDQFIVDHRELADEVRATVYEDGTTVVVNYGDQTYRQGDRTVEALNFAVWKEAQR